MTSESMTGVAVLAHGVHYGLIVGGLLGVAALVAPTFRGRVRPARGPELDEHAVRVARLRRRIDSGTLATLETRPAPTAVVPGARADLPAAVVASTAAAGVHAAVAPAHLAGGLAVGAFFLLCAGAQLAWAARVLRRSTAALLVTGAVGNAVVLALWLVSRTSGLPGTISGVGAGVGVEPVGPWDLACAAWEVTVVVVCVARLGAGRTVDRVAPWPTWSTSVLVLLGGSAFVLLVLTFSGASS